MTKDVYNSVAIISKNSHLYLLSKWCMWSILYITYIIYSMNLKNLFLLIIVTTRKMYLFI